MRRFAATLLALAALTGLTAGCGSESETTAATEEPTPFATPPKPEPQAEVSVTPAPSKQVSAAVKRELAGGGIALYDLAGRTLIRPEQVDFSGDAALVSVKWSSWAPEGAVGTGIATYSDCDPNCIDGEKKRVKATIRMSTPRSCDGNLFFAESAVEVSTGPALRSYLRAPC